MIELTEWVRRARFPDKPWMMLGKGPTFSRRDEFDLRAYNLLSLNHAVLAQAVDVAHIVDIDVVEDCGDRLLSNSRWVVMPRHPHVHFRASVARLEDFIPVSRTLRLLDEQGRLVWYNAATGPAEPGSPVMDLRYFSSEAALAILSRLGARSVRSLGVDGGGAYSGAFTALRARTLLRNGQPSFNAQFAELDRIAREHRLDYEPLVPPLRVFIGADETQAIPAAVLQLSITESCDHPVRVDLLDQPLARRPRARRNQPRTPFSFGRFRIPELTGFRGTALYLDSDMLVFADVSELFALPFGGKKVLCSRQAEPPNQWRNHPDFRPGRQFSVMLIDCARATWTLDDVIDGLDRGDFTYEELMFDLALVDEDDIGESIPATWNHLEHFEPGVTKNLHYTVVPSQPWRAAGNPNEGPWLEAYARAVSRGAVRMEDVETAVRRGWVRADLLTEAEARIVGETPATSAIEVELAALRNALALVSQAGATSTRRGSRPAARHVAGRAWRVAATAARRMRRRSP